MLDEGGFCDALFGLLIALAGVFILGIRDVHDVEYRLFTIGVLACGGELITSGILVTGALVGNVVPDHSDVMKLDGVLIFEVGLLSTGGAVGSLCVLFSEVGLCTENEHACICTLSSKDAAQRTGNSLSLLRSMQIIFFLVSLYLSNTFS